MKSYIYFFTLELTKWSSVILVWKSRAAKSLVVIIVSDTSSMSSIIGVKFNLEVIKHYQSRTVIHGDVIAIPYVVSTKASLALVSWYQWERWKKSNRHNDRRLICTDDLRMLTLLDPVTYNGLVLFKLCENAKKGPQCTWHRMFKRNFIHNIIPSIMLDTVSSVSISFCPFSHL